jgi:hypothetical protein
MPRLLVLLGVIAVLILVGISGSEVGEGLGNAVRYILEVFSGIFRGIGNPSEAVG